MTRSEQISNQDYNLVDISTQKITEKFGSTYNFSETSIGFLFLVLSSIFKRQEEEIISDITDTFFLKKLDEIDGGPDRGIDAVIIDDENKVVHLFNFKYYEKSFSSLKITKFRGKEVNEIIVFIKDLFEENEEGFSGNSANNRLENKVKEIWAEQKEGAIYKFNIHFVANIFNGLPEQEEKRLYGALEKYKDCVYFDYILANDISNVLTSRTKNISCKFQALSSNFFDKLENGNKALILEISAIDLLRIVSDGSKLRDSIDFDNNEIINSEIEEAVFDENVRVYLKQRTNINKNIKKTALDNSEKGKIFFYNNGITITCDRILHQHGKKSPTITLTNFQIVNGGQTVHALRSAFIEDKDNFEQITVLCKIYETTDKEFKSKIAEYTNSQNPVKDRDIRSIDSVQIKLEEEFKQLGYFYERKRNQHEDESKDKKIDAEKLGQAILTFELGMPAESKNKKSIIFGSKYEEIFNDELSAKQALKVYKLYLDVEKCKAENRKRKPYLMHATYYIMFFIKKLLNKKQVEEATGLYNEALQKIEHVIKKEKQKLGDDYSDAILFKYNRPKDYLTELGL